MQKCLKFLDYAALQEEAIVTYHASNMKLAIHSDASYPPILPEISVHGWMMPVPGRCAPSSYHLVRWLRLA